jgi:probable F420-dependent oxidoreductase
MTAMAASSHSIRIAVQFHPQHGDWTAMRAAVLAAEEMGVDIAYNWDHFFPLYGDPDGKHFECWTTLAAWAEASERIELGPLVTCNSYRNPQLLADMARTVDHIAGGRLVFGIGAGWFDRDFEEYGYPFDTAARRLQSLEDALPLVEARWDRLNPPPVRRPPILIGGTGERRTLRLVARHADMWHATFPEHPEELAPKVDALHRHCAEEGRDPTTIERAVGVEPEDLERFLHRDAETYVEMGFAQFTLGRQGPDWDLAEVRPWLDWRDEVNRARSVRPA